MMHFSIKATVGGHLECPISLDRVSYPLAALTAHQTLSALMSRRSFLLVFPFPSTTSLILLLIMCWTLHKLAVLSMSASVADLVLRANTALRGWHYCCRSFSRRLSEFAACGKEFESFQEIVERDAKKGQLYCTGKSLIYLARGARS